jgi:hypothetical protein
MKAEHSFLRDLTTVYRMAFLAGETDRCSRIADTVREKYAPWTYTDWVREQAAFMGEHRKGAA